MHHTHAPLTKGFCRALSLDNKGNPLYLKMKTTKDIKQKSVKEFAVKHIAKGSTIKSDIYLRFEPALIDYIHEPVKYIPKGMVLPKTSEKTMSSFRFDKSGNSEHGSFGLVA